MHKLRRLLGLGYICREDICVIECFVLFGLLGMTVVLLGRLGFLFGVSRWAFLWLSLRCR